MFFWGAVKAPRTQHTHVDIDSKQGEKEFHQVADVRIGDLLTGVETLACSTTPGIEDKRLIDGTHVYFCEQVLSKDVKEAKCLDMNISDLSDLEQLSKLEKLSILGKNSLSRTIEKTQSAQIN
ncbi:MAG: hypothetical protein GY854_23115 [Deltaproteobacteria bacterium]|nr:hypothetical protein [Deltaproteobacteria bacterium]